VTHAQAHIDRPRDGTHRHRPPVDPGILARWRLDGCLAAADVATILADRDPADAHPLASYVARLRAAR
jgi:hypothetical protein